MLSRAAVAARYGARSFAAVTTVALGQAVVHEQSYRPLPTLTAPEMGLELPEFLREKREILRRKLEAKKEQVKEIMRTLPRRKTQSGKSYRVLFIGDSLVTGVGGEQSDAMDGPPLPRRVSRALANSLEVQVEWRSVGLTGGDLQALRSTLREGVHENYDVVVVMCGLNDFKHLARGQIRTPWTFQSELRGLIDDLRTHVGHDARIILPALPIALASFHEPLKSYIVFLANLWDKQKARVAQASHRLLDRRVEYVDVLTVQEDGESSSLVADDGVHPSEFGYALWATHIADQIVAKEPPAVRAARRLSPPLR